MNMPALGIKPLWLHNVLRLDEINKAIDRYHENDQTIPIEWEAEKETLIEYLSRCNEKT